jgi:uncharacterized protein
MATSPPAVAPHSFVVSFRMRLITTLFLAGLAMQASRPDVPAVEGALRQLVPPLPPGGTYISDARGLIGAGPLASLNARIGTLQRQGLGDIAVAIVPSIGDYTPSEVGVAIYRTWRVGRIDSIGSARRNLGVLLLIVPKELAPDSSGVCWITTGRGAEGIVTDAASGRICRDVIVPHLRERDYAAAVSAAIDALEERLRSDAGLQVEDPAALAPSDEDAAPGWLWMVPSGLIALGGGAAGAVYWRRHHRRKCPNCGRKMERLSETADDAKLEHGQRVEERVRSVDYDVWQCPGCGETIVLPYGRVFSSFRKCVACGRKTLRTKRKVLKKATYTSTGVAEDTHHCEACGVTRVERVVLPKETPPSSSSSGGGGGFGGGGGGGGGGFGGSGSTGGGGGGSRY